MDGEPIYVLYLALAGGPSILRVFRDKGKANHHLRRITAPLRSDEHCGCPSPSAIDVVGAKGAWIEEIEVD